MSDEYPERTIPIFYCHHKKRKRGILLNLPGGLQATVNLHSASAVASSKSSALSSISFLLPNNRDFMEFAAAIILKKTQLSA